MLMDYDVFNLRGVAGMCMAMLLIACQSAPKLANTWETARLPGASLECVPSGLSREPLEASAVRDTLEFTEGAPHYLTIEYAYALRGECAPLVDEAVQSLVLLADDSVYDIGPTGKGVQSWPRGKSAFNAKNLELRSVPTFNGEKFIDADDYQSLRTSAEMEERFIGLWSDGKRSTIAAFAVPSNGTGEVRCVLLRSKLPLRGVTFFPSADQPSGEIWLVQEAPGQQIRVIAIQWRHAGVFRGRATAPC